jgi:Transcriptional regulator, AbiEi antitoxin/Protein of unknown function (DUF559)
VAGWDERQLARMAVAQDGVVTLRQLEAAGLGRGALRVRRAQRRLVPLHRGVYAIGPGEVTEHGRFRAAVWACGADTLLADLAAARLLATWERPVPRPQVVVPWGRNPRPRGVDVRRSATLTAADRTHVRGIPCTSMSRTLVDLAASPVLEAVFERAERRRLIRPAGIEEVMRRRSPVPGAERLRALLETHRPKSGPTRSLLEHRLLAGLRRAGLPEPVVNGSLELDGELLEPDLMWPRERVLVELDGLETHATRTAMRRDRARDRRAALAGWVPLRFTWDDVAQVLSEVLRDIACTVEHRMGAQPCNQSAR